MSWVRPAGKQLAANSLESTAARPMAWPSDTYTSNRQREQQVRWRNCSSSSSRLNVEDSSCNCLGSCCNLCLVDSCCILGIHQVSQTGAVAHTVVVLLLLLRLLHRLLVPLAQVLDTPEPFAPSCNSCCKPNLLFLPHSVFWSRTTTTTS